MWEVFWQLQFGAGCHEGVLYVIFLFFLFLMILRFGRIDWIMFFFVEWRLHDFYFCFLQFGETKGVVPIYFFNWMKVAKLFFALVVWRSWKNDSKIYLFCWMKVVGFLFCFLQFGKVGGEILILSFVSYNLEKWKE